MAYKFGRNYSLYVQAIDLTIFQISLPFTIDFDINRNILSGSSTATFRIMNLSSNTRNNLRKDLNDFTQFRTISFNAGYGYNTGYGLTNSKTPTPSPLPVAFSGTIQQAWSVREGMNFVTEIHAYDGGFAKVNGTIDLPVGAASTVKQAITKIINTPGSLPGVTPGMVGSYPKTIPRGNTYSGNTMDVLNQLSGNGAFIDNGQVNVLGDNEFVPGILSVISPQTGLLGTPVLENTYLKFDMIFEPTLVIGQQITLQSDSGALATGSYVANNVGSGSSTLSGYPAFNGSYKILAVKHRGTISATVCGDAVTTAQLDYQKAILPVGAT